MVSRTGTFLILFFVLSVNQINCDSNAASVEKVAKVEVPTKVDESTSDSTEKGTRSEADDMVKTANIETPTENQPADKKATENKVISNPISTESATKKPEKNITSLPLTKTEVPKVEIEEPSKNNVSIASTPVTASSTTTSTTTTTTTTSAPTTTTTKTSAPTTTTNTTSAPTTTTTTTSAPTTTTTTTSAPTTTTTTTSAPTTTQNPSSSASTSEPGETENPVNATTPVPKKNVDNHRRSSGFIVLMAALCFAFTVVLTYFGLVLWRRYMNNRYGNRQLLVNEMEFDATADFPRFEL